MRKSSYGFASLGVLAVLLVALIAGVVALPNFNGDNRSKADVLATSTATFLLAQNSDAANEDGNSFKILPGAMFIGTGGSTTKSYLGLRFSGPAIPKGTTIQSAQLKITAEKETWIYVGFDIFAENTLSAATFSSSSKPSTRSVTSAKKTVSEDVKWVAGQTYSYDVKNVIQEYVNNFESNNIALIIKGGNNQYGRKYPFSSLSGAPKLEIVYSTNGTQPVASATPTPTSASQTTTPKPTSTPTIKPTSTPLATITPAPTRTPTPTPISSTTPPTGGTGGSVTLTAAGGYGVGSNNNLEVGIRTDIYDMLRADAAKGVYDRACTAAEHDKTKWHSLVNPVAKCHYDHFHGDDPTYVNDLFGEPGTWFGNPGQGVSHPWQTFGAKTMTESNAAYIASGSMENDLKHEGYGWIVRRNQPCNDRFCVTDFRLLLHNLEMQAFGAATRFHSVYGEMRVCADKSNPSSCGIIRTGGWLDHGNLLTPPANADCWESRQNNVGLIKLPSDTQFYTFFDPDLIDEFRCHKPLSPAQVASGPASSGSRAPSEWWAHGASDFRYQFLVFNPIGNVAETAPGSGVLQMHSYCTRNQNDCRWNQSIFTVRVAYILPVHSYYVSGFTSGLSANLPLGRRYITRFGDINNSCTKAGLDCIPIEYSNLTLNVSPGEGLAGYNQETCENCQKMDHDLTPNGRPSWVTWYYDKFGL